MSLPATFSDGHEYFTAAVDFLKAHSWIYKHSNTCFIKAGVLNGFPLEYVDYFLNVNNEQLNQFPFVHRTDFSTDIEMINKFRMKVKSLIPVEAYKEAELVDSTRSTLTRKINVKKQHEILRLGHLISTLCDANYMLLDFGSGLGYLSEILCRLNTNKYQILCLEGDKYRVEAAQKRQPRVANVQHIQHFINKDSQSFIEQNAHKLAQINQREPLTHLAIVGLHACADLTITAMKLFFRMANVRKLIIMPCCYHKLQMSESDNTFTNFPLSNALKQAVHADSKSTEFLNRPFLRLACQQTLERWCCCSIDEHEKHSREMFWRAAMDAALESETEVVVKRKLNCSRNVEQLTPFDYICNQYSLLSKVTKEPLPWHKKHENQFNSILKTYYHGEKLVEGLTCLQTTIQKLCENIVLYDRLCYMQENATAQGLNINVRFRKILDEKLSPRCHALIAEKL